MVDNRWWNVGTRAGAVLVLIIVIGLLASSASAEPTVTVYKSPT